jgi:hypothetical protein
MRAIITRENRDGSFDNVGMNNRIVSRSYMSEAQLIRHAVVPYAESSPTGWVRVEVFRATLHGTPDSVFTFNGITGKRGKV